MEGTKKTCKRVNEGRMVTQLDTKRTVFYGGRTFRLQTLRSVSLLPILVTTRPLVKAYIL